MTAERLATGRLTWTPRCSMGAATMKMMSSTSITSTRGTTLISDSVEVTRRPRRWRLPVLEDAGEMTLGIYATGEPTATRGEANQFRQKYAELHTTHACR